MPEANRAAGRIVGPGEPQASPAEETDDSLEPDEVIKRETAVFIPGTHGKKPQAK